MRVNLLTRDTTIYDCDRAYAFFLEKEDSDG